MFIYQSLEIVGKPIVLWWKCHCIACLVKLACAFTFFQMFLKRTKLFEEMCSYNFKIDSACYDHKMDNSLFTNELWIISLARLMRLYFLKKIQIKKRLFYMHRVYPKWYSELWGMIIHDKTDIFCVGNGRLNPSIQAKIQDGLQKAKSRFLFVTATITKISLWNLQYYVSLVSENYYDIQRKAFVAL